MILFPMGLESESYLAVSGFVKLLHWESLVAEELITAIPRAIKLGRT